MKKLVVFLISLLAVLAIFYVVRFTYRANTGQLVSNRGDVKLLDWKEFTSPTGDFKILFAVEPRHINRDDTNVKRDAYRVTNKGVGYTVNVARYPFGFATEEAGAILEEAVKANIMSGQKLVSSSFTYFTEYPALDYIVDTVFDTNPTLHDKGKAILVNDGSYTTLYLVFVTYSDSLDEQSYGAFINSFKILRPN